jgi:hypothetical protein
MWSFDRLVFLTRETGGLVTPRGRGTRNVRLNLPSTHVPLFHAWKP